MSIDLCVRNVGRTSGQTRYRQGPRVDLNLLNLLHVYFTAGICAFSRYTEPDAIGQLGKIEKAMERAPFRVCLPCHSILLRFLLVLCKDRIGTLP
jgi:hypothetical protein